MRSSNGSAIVDFSDLESFKEVLKFVWDKGFPVTADGTKAQIVARKYLGPQQYEEERESRILTKTIGDLATDHVRGMVLFGREVAGEFHGQGNERIFKIDAVAINAEARRLGIDLMGSYVKEEYDRRIIAFRQNRI